MRRPTVELGTPIGSRAPPPAMCCRPTRSFRRPSSLTYVPIFPADYRTSDRKRRAPASPHQRSDPRSPRACAPRGRRVRTIPRNRRGFWTRSS